MDIPDMVRLINDVFQSLGSFNVDLLVVYDQIYNSFSLQKGVVDYWGCFGEDAFNEDNSSDLQAIIDQIIARLILSSHQGLQQCIEEI